MNAISVNNLEKYFDEPIRSIGKKTKNSKPKKGDQTIRAVDGISFQVEKGEIFGFLGPNGAGKTTTIRMMTGVLKPTKGKITILEQDMWKNPIPVKQITGNVPEMANVYVNLTGWRNLLFIGELYGISKKKRIKQAEDLLKKFSLYEKRNLKARKYSKGMTQRLLLCMALMSNPRILFLDEPTSGLDVQSSRIIKKIILEYNKDGVTIFLTTHDMDVANELCNRIAIINHGKIISLDTPENLKKISQENLAIDCIFYEETDINDIKKLKTAKEVQKIKNGYHIYVENVHNAISEITDYCNSNNLKIKHISTYEPKLEEAFLKIVEKGA